MQGLVKDMPEIPLYMWYDVPEGISKILKAIETVLFSQDASLRNIEKHIVNNMKFEKEMALVSGMISSQSRETEQLLTRKLAVQTGKLTTRIDNIDLSLCDVLKEFSTVKKKLDSICFERVVDTMKYEIKKDLIEDFIDPFKYELAENYKTISQIEQQVKVSDWNFEATTKEFNSRFDLYKEKITKIENISDEFAKEVDSIILRQISPVKETVLRTEKQFNKIYSDFHNECDEIILKMYQKRKKMKNKFNEALKDMDAFKIKTNGIIEKIINDNSLHAKQINESVEKIVKEFSSFKSQVLVSQKNCFDEARKEVMKSYKNDLKIVEDKLKWLPSNLEDISDMTPFEARLYTIETRIKVEEDNRISQVNDIIKSKIYSDVPAIFMKSRKAKHHEKNKLSNAIIKNKSPTPPPTKLCTSPGGMRIYTSLSSQRIKKKNELSENLLNSNKNIMNN